MVSSVTAAATVKARLKTIKREDPSTITTVSSSFSEKKAERDRLQRLNITLVGGSNKTVVEDEEEDDQYSALSSQTKTTTTSMSSAKMRIREMEEKIKAAAAKSTVPVGNNTAAALFTTTRRNTATTTTENNLANAKQDEYHSNVKNVITAINSNSSSKTNSSKDDAPVLSSSSSSSSGSSGGKSGGSGNGKYSSTLKQLASSQGNEEHGRNGNTNKNDSAELNYFQQPFLNPNTTQQPHSQDDEKTTTTSSSNDSQGKYSSTLKQFASSQGNGKRAANGTNSSSFQRNYFQQHRQQLLTPNTSQPKRPENENTTTCTPTSSDNKDIPEDENFDDTTTTTTTSNNATQEDEDFNETNSTTSNNDSQKDEEDFDETVSSVMQCSSSSTMKATATATRMATDDPSVADSLASLAIAQSSSTVSSSSSRHRVVEEDVATEDHPEADSLSLAITQSSSTVSSSSSSTSTNSTNSTTSSVGDEGSKGSRRERLKKKGKLMTKKNTTAEDTIGGDDEQQRADDEDAKVQQQQQPTTQTKVVVRKDTTQRYNTQQYFSHHRRFLFMRPKKEAATTMEAEENGRHPVEQDTDDFEIDHQFSESDNGVEDDEDNDSHQDFDEDKMGLTSPTYSGMTWTGSTIEDDLDYLRANASGDSSTKLSASSSSGVNRGAIVSSMPRRGGGGEYSSFRDLCGLEGGGESAESETQCASSSIRGSGSEPAVLSSSLRGSESKRGGQPGSDADEDDNAGIVQINWSGSDLDEETNDMVTSHIEDSSRAMVNAQREELFYNHRRRVDDSAAGNTTKDQVTPGVNTTIAWSGSDLDEDPDSGGIRADANTKNTDPVTPGVHTTIAWSGSDLDDFDPEIEDSCHISTTIGHHELESDPRDDDNQHNENSNQNTNIERKDATNQDGKFVTNGNKQEQVGMNIAISDKNAMDSTSSHSSLSSFATATVHQNNSSSLAHTTSGRTQALMDDTTTAASSLVTNREQSNHTFMTPGEISAKTRTRTNVTSPPNKKTIAEASPVINEKGYGDCIDTVFSTALSAYSNGNGIHNEDQKYEEDLLDVFFENIHDRICEERSNRNERSINVEDDIDDDDKSKTMHNETEDMIICKLLLNPILDHLETYDPVFEKLEKYACPEDDSNNNDNDEAQHQETFRNAYGAIVATNSDDLSTVVACPDKNTIDTTKKTSSATYAAIAFTNLLDRVEKLDPYFERCHNAMGKVLSTVAKKEDEETINIDAEKENEDAETSPKSVCTKATTGSNTAQRKAGNCFTSNTNMRINLNTDVLDNAFERAETMLKEQKEKASGTQIKKKAFERAESMLKKQKERWFVARVNWKLRKSMPAADAMASVFANCTTATPTAANTKRHSSKNTKIDSTIPIDVINNIDDDDITFFSVMSPSKEYAANGDSNTLKKDDKEEEEEESTHITYSDYVLRSPASQNDNSLIKVASSAGPSDEDEETEFTTNEGDYDRRRTYDGTNNTTQQLESIVAGTGTPRGTARVGDSSLFVITEEIEVTESNESECSDDDSVYDTYSTSSDMHPSDRFRRWAFQNGLIAGENGASSHRRNVRRPPSGQEKPSTLLGKWKNTAEAISGKLLDNTRCSTTPVRFEDFNSFDEDDADADEDLYKRGGKKEKKKTRKSDESRRHSNPMIDDDFVESRDDDATEAPSYSYEDDLSGFETAVDDNEQHDDDIHPMIRLNRSRDRRCRNDERPPIALPRDERQQADDQHPMLRLNRSRSSLCGESSIDGSTGGARCRGSGDDKEHVSLLLSATDGETTVTLNGYDPDYKPPRGYGAVEDDISFLSSGTNSFTLDHKLQKTHNNIKSDGHDHSTRSTGDDTATMYSCISNHNSLQSNSINRGYKIRERPESTIASGQDSRLEYSLADSIRHSSITSTNRDRRKKRILREPRGNRLIINDKSIDEHIDSTSRHCKDITPTSMTEPSTSHLPPPPPPPLSLKQKNYGRIKSKTSSEMKNTSELKIANENSTYAGAVVSMAEERTGAFNKSSLDIHSKHQDHLAQTGDSGNVINAISNNNSMQEFVDVPSIHTTNTASFMDCYEEAIPSNGFSMASDMMSMATAAMSMTPDTMLNNSDNNRRKERRSSTRSIGTRTTTESISKTPTGKIIGSNNLAMATDTMSDVMSDAMSFATAAMSMTSDMMTNYKSSNDTPKTLDKEATKTMLSARLIEKRTSVASTKNSTVEDEIPSNKLSMSSDTISMTTEMMLAYNGSKHGENCSNDTTDREKQVEGEEVEISLNVMSMETDMMLAYDGTKTRNDNQSGGGKFNKEETRNESNADNGTVTTDVMSSVMSINTDMMLDYKSISNNDDQKKNSFSLPTEVISLSNEKIEELLRSDALSPAKLVLYVTWLSAYYVLKNSCKTNVKSTMVNDYCNIYADDSLFDDVDTVNTLTDFKHKTDSDMYMMEAGPSDSTIISASNDASRLEPKKNNKSSKCHRRHRQRFTIEDRRRRRIRATRNFDKMLLGEELISNSSSASTIYSSSEDILERASRNLPIMTSSEELENISYV